MNATGKNPELVAYVQDMKRKGVPEDILKKHLANYGYDTQSISECFASIKANRRKIPWMLIAIGFLIVLAIMCSIFFIITMFLPKLDTCNDVSLQIYSLDNQSVICAFPDLTKVQMIIENAGGADLDGFMVHINDKKADEVTALALPPGQVFTRVVPWDGSAIKKVRITPLSKGVTCKPLQIATLATC